MDASWAAPLCCCPVLAGILRGICSGRGHQRTQQSWRCGSLWLSNDLVVTEADAEAIYELLFAARDEIPLSKIETDPKEDSLNCIRLWCALNRSLVAELNGEVVSVAIVIRANAFKCR